MGSGGGGRVEKMLAIHKQQSNRCDDSPSSPLLLAPLYSFSTAKEAANSSKLQRKFFFPVGKMGCANPVDVGGGHVVDVHIPVFD
jgi:hypothetical protein